MKRLVSVCLLMLCLSLPVFGGHHLQGGFGYCDCDPVGNVCPCCGGSLLAVANDQENDSITQHASDGAELSIIRLAFLMWLKIKA